MTQPTPTLRLAIGSPAPAFTLTAADGSSWTMREHLDSGLLVYFYPEAMTPACTAQACDFRDAVPALASLGLSVVGISPDPVAKLSTFATEESLPFVLLSDPDHVVATRWGVYGEKNSYGRIITGTIRSTFVVDSDGLITQAWYNVKATGHVARVAKALGLS